MKLSSIPLLLASTFACKAVSAYSSDYDSLLNDIVKSDYDSPSGGEGQVTLSSLSGLSTLSNLAKRDAEPYFKELDMFSFDNYEKLTKVKNMLAHAQSNEMLGDALYLYNFMNRNGHSKGITLNDSSEFVTETCKLLSSYGLNNTDILASTASSSFLVDFYKNFDVSVCDINQLTKRYNYFSCDANNHVTSSDACWKLHANIADHGSFPNSPRSYCVDVCCMSWSAPATFDAHWAQIHLSECIFQCITPSGSCQIREAVYYDKRFSFCVSNRANGCT
ncbi:hypothetical protein SJAG_02944 [Schizosaccharomyces japonicus yFS275]|uniref:WD-like domain-containing protein n=1 Tax=Schizosaccharomyces japonicus (strain yFS275 / FY16936) TaxID=402676 RepID=B6K2X0_SCHJY|nr:hypothetical protein SJAG_02944 [Schizosaccharomyces japonicus yFS275]EEB07827.1 hypothetical protein SJAG_02944 [Schizosaccharomyces japonicus yFS275]